jgi:peptide/nickel transport system permease protein
MTAARAHAWRRLARQPVTLASLAVLICLFALGGLAHEIAPNGWNEIDLAARWQNHAPTLAGWTHLFGTDNIGRDILVRTLWGLHYTEISALLGALLATLVGLLVGGIAGLYGGWVDTSLMRAADLATTFPVIVVMIVVFFFLEPLTVAKATLVFTLYLWAFVARAVRARFSWLRNEEFVEAARALGASDARIFFRHLLPNAAATVVVAGTSLVGQIILVEATVEFFGFGVASLLRPTLGNLIADATSTGIGGNNQLGLGWWVWAPAAALLVLILVCVNLVGDGLAEALDPHS